MKTRAHKDPWFKPKDMPVVRDYYVAKSQARHPLASPVFADLSDLPPLYVQVGEDEILLSDSIRCAEQVEAAGGDIELEIWPGMWHVFQVFVHRMPESRAAIQKIGEFIRRVLKVEGSSET